MSKSFVILIAVALMIFSSCKKEEEQISYADPSTIFQDQYGRQLTFRGLNTSNDAKWLPGGMPWIQESDVEREDKEFGFNFVRLLTAWQFVEPQPGVYDEDYLNRYAERVNWYTSRGMYVLIDIHQNVYGQCSKGFGAPPWACVEEGLEPFPPDLGLPWWFNNISPISVAAWRNFFNYNKHPWLQDHFINMWKVLVNRFKDNPYVIGYDILNEPWPGDPIRVLNGEFERKELAQFNQRVINAIREIDQEKYIFFQPLPAPVTFGFPSTLPGMEDARAGTRRLAYAPHLYPLSLHENNDYSSLDRRNFRDWERERRKDQRTQGMMPLLCGEFGVSPQVQGFDEFLTDALAMFDRHLWHWAYWSNDRGQDWSPLNQDLSESPILSFLVRTYPKATAGTIQSFSFDRETNRFDMSFLSNPAIAQATEIFLPRRYYPNGWDLKVEGTKDYSYEYEEARQLLKLTVKNAAAVKVVIEAK